MTLLKDIKNYTINGEKIDDCQANWVGSFENPMWALCVSLVFAFPVVAVTLIEKDFRIFVIAILAALSVDVIIIVLYIFSSVVSGRGCGIKISLDTKNTWYSFSNCCKYKKYKFTGDEDTDAREILKIVAEFENYANELNFLSDQQHLEAIRKDREVQEKSKECCDAYRKVVEKVKK